jgi:hypothetical protein
MEPEGVSQFRKATSPRGHGRASEEEDLRALLSSRSPDREVASGLATVGHRARRDDWNQLWLTPPRSGRRC